MTQQFMIVPRKALRVLLLLLCGLSVPAVHADAPLAPSQLRASIYSPASAEVFWARAYDDQVVTGYELVLNGRVLGIFDTLSYQLNDLTPRAQYDFSVTAIDNDRNRSATTSLRLLSGISSGPIQLDQPVVLESPVAPDPPTVVDIPSTSVGIVATPEGLYSEVYSETTVEVFWDRVYSSDLTYRVYVDGNFHGSTDGISHYIDGLENGVEYEIKVVAVDSLRGSSTPASLLVAPYGLLELPAPDVADELQAPLPPSIAPVPDAPIVSDPTIPDTVFSPLDNDIQTDRSVYTQNGYANLNVIRVDLRTVTGSGPCTADEQSGCTLADVLADTDKTDDKTVDIAVHFKSDDFPDDGLLSNAELRQRGGGSRFGAQKSFRIKLDNKKKPWRTERFLQLNKHPFESDRMRNKLAMDLMSRVPHLPSFRTQFVNLWIDDGQGPVDYGLFTHVERTNKSYLKSRGLDKDGNLYKASGFRFDLTDLEDVRVDADGKPLDKDRFEGSLEIEEGKDHRALVNMLTALNDPQRSFESVLDQYFNRNNVLAWMAVNMLLKQDDATRHNYVLYNPSDSETFYFLPWDYDATMARWELPADYAYRREDLNARIIYGYALGSENVFVEKFYKMPGAHDLLLRATQTIRQDYFDHATIDDLSRRNAELVGPYQKRLPDSQFNTLYPDAPSFAENISWNADAIAGRFSVPVPPTLFEPTLDGDDWRFTWLPAYDPTGHGVSYDLQIATSRAFLSNEVVVNITGIDDQPDAVNHWVNASLLPAGSYFVRLIARSDRQPSRYWVPARNRTTENGQRYYGMLRFDTGG